jgi:hypothetical protein
MLCVKNLKSIADTKFNLEKLSSIEAGYVSEYEKALAADTWRKRFKGRDVLSRFAGRIGKVKSEVFRDLIITNMRDAGFQPEGMRNIINKILGA